MNVINLLSIAPELSYGEKISNYLPNMLMITGVGIVSVFVIIGILIGFVYLMKLCVSMSTKGKSNVKAIQNDGFDSIDEIDELTVAAIMLAISATMENAVPNVDFVVRRIKRIK